MEAPTKRQSSLLAFFSQPPNRNKRRSTEVTADPGADTTRKRPNQASRFVKERGWQVTSTTTDASGRQCVVYDDGEGSRLRYWPAFMPADEASRLYDHLHATTKWSQGGRSTHKSPNTPSISINSDDVKKGGAEHEAKDEDDGVSSAKEETKEGEWMRGRASYVNTYGTRVSTPRLQKHYGRGIAGGCKFRCGFREWPAELWDVKSRVEAAADRPFNFVLLNFYRNESDYMSVHTDAGPFLGSNPAIGSLSLGATRRFVLHHADRQKKPPVPRFELSLAHGSLLVMEGATQHRWVHSVPKVRSVTAGRINLTFRFILDDFGDDRREDTPKD